MAKSKIQEIPIYVDNRLINEMIKRTKLGIMAQGKIGQSDKRAVKSLVSKVLKLVVGDIQYKLIGKEPVCSKCGSNDIKVFDSNNDWCNICGTYFPAVISETSLNKSTIKKHIRQVAINCKIKL